MSEPNYNETVVVPLLQKKVQEMNNQILFLEANFLVQQARCKWLEERLAEANAKVDSLSKRGKKKEEAQLDGQTY
jgi:hypothetical protein